MHRAKHVALETGLHQSGCSKISKFCLKNCCFLNKFFQSLRLVAFGVRYGSLLRMPPYWLCSCIIDISKRKMHFEFHLVSHDRKGKGTVLLGSYFKMMTVSNLRVICLIWVMLFQRLIHTSFKGYCTSYQKLACFVLYLKRINTFLKNNICIL